MSPPNARGRPTRERPQESKAGRPDTHQDTAAAPGTLPCRPWCSLSCPTASWWHVLDDVRPAPPAQRLAWSLVGLPDPLPADQWPDLLDAFERTYGVEAVVEGLRLAAEQPLMSAGCGGPWLAADRARARALLATAERRLAVAA